MFPCPRYGAPPRHTGGPSAGVPPVNALHVTQTAARLMYYMTGTDRRPSNHGGSSLMLLLPVAAAGLYQVMLGYTSL